MSDENNCTSMFKSVVTGPDGGCPSTHGMAGYAPHTYVDKDGNIVCGLCGEVIGKAGDDNLKRLPKWVIRR